MDIDKVKQMKCDEFKNYLRLRGLKVSGKKDVLIARVFIADENNVPIINTAVEIEQILETEYKDKLKINENFSMQDPYKIKIGWLDEDEGVRYWPLISAINVINFLMLGSEVDLNDYKSSKAYSYFANGWLGKLSLLTLNDPNYSLFMADCRPSQRIKDTKHKLWILLTNPYGQVINAHCSCMAGKKN